jgi:tRNA G18 (ribose-2'-O)-methylase SpoU
VQVIYGINPLLEVLLSHPAMLEKVVVADGRGGNEVRKILKLAAEHGIPVELGGKIWRRTRSTRGLRVSAGRMRTPPWMR